MTGTRNKEMMTPTKKINPRKINNVQEIRQIEPLQRFQDLIKARTDDSFSNTMEGFAAAKLAAGISRINGNAIMKIILFIHNK